MTATTPGLTLAQRGDPTVQPDNPRVFPTLRAARTYRHEHGTGGWIFTTCELGESILFPPDLPPIAIFHHPLTKGRAGRLIGNG